MADDDGPGFGACNGVPKSMHLTQFGDGGNQFMVGVRFVRLPKLIHIKHGMDFPLTKKKRPSEQRQMNFL
jgi:hypothetical protein